MCLAHRLYRGLVGLAVVAVAHPVGGGDGGDFSDLNQIEAGSSIEQGRRAEHRGRPYRLRRYRCTGADQLVRRRPRCAEVARASPRGGRHPMSQRAFRSLRCRRRASPRDPDRSCRPRATTGTPRRFAATVTACVELPVDALPVDASFTRHHEVRADKPLVEADGVENERGPDTSRAPRNATTPPPSLPAAPPPGKLPNVHAQRTPQPPPRTA